jgi:hypothetical protein
LCHAADIGTGSTWSPAEYKSGNERRHWKQTP